MNTAAPSAPPVASASTGRGGSSRAVEVIGLCAAVVIVAGGAVFLHARRGERG
jgi:hypothetical protein